MTTGTTSRTISTSIRPTARRRDFRRVPATARTLEGCASSPSSSSTTRPTSTRGSRRRGARRAGSSKRNYYVWSDTDRTVPERADHLQRHRTIELDVGSGGGPVLLASLLPSPARSELRQPAVSKAVLRVMHFWLDMGVDGMRLDAVPYLVEREGTSCAGLPETHAILKRIRADLDARYPDRMLLAEANQWPSDVCALLRRQRRVPHGVSLSADAAAVRGAAARGIGTRSVEILSQMPRHPRHAASGRSSCATTTS